MLDTIGVAYGVATVDIDEVRLVSEGDAAASVRAIAEAKFAALAESVDADLLLTADTLVACDGAIMGKPPSDDALVAMLNEMSGHALSIVTAVCIGAPGSTPATDTVTTTVKLRVLRGSEIADYVATGVGSDKAGGLALQAEAGPFIDSVDGCWADVLGLPVCLVEAMLAGASGDDGARDCSVERCGGHGA